MVRPAYRLVDEQLQRDEPDEDTRKIEAHRTTTMPANVESFQEFKRSDAAGPTRLLPSVVVVRTQEVVDSTRHDFVAFVCECQLPSRRLVYDRSERLHR